LAAFEAWRKLVLKAIETKLMVDAHAAGKTWALFQDLYQPYSGRPDTDLQRVTMHKRKNCPLDRVRYAFAWCRLWLRSKG
jgi:hypothetical protein